MASAEKEMPPNTVLTTATFEMQGVPNGNSSDSFYGQKDRICFVVGGSFFPLHEGHLNLLRTAQQHLEKHHSKQVVRAILSPSHGAALCHKFPHLLLADVQGGADNRTKLALRLLHQHNFSILQQQEERPEEEQVEHQHLPGIPVEWDDCLLQSTHNVGMGATMAALAKEVATCDQATLVQVVGPDSHVRAILKDAMMADVVEKAITTPKPTKNIHYL